MEYTYWELDNGDNILPKWGVGRMGPQFYVNTWEEDVAQMVDALNAQPRMVCMACGGTSRDRDETGAHNCEYTVAGVRIA